MRFWMYLLISISYLMAGLLTYTATKKLTDYESHLAHIRDIELMSRGLAVWAARAVIAVEYGLALVLLVPLNRVQIWGWKAVVLLMAVYCYYIYHVQHYAPFTPCSCHGIDKRLTWGQQYDINLGLAALASLVLGIHYSRKWIWKKIKLIIHKFKKMKKIFSIILPLLFFSGAIVFAFNTQDEPICSDRGHIGYSYSGTGEPPTDFDPDNLPSTLTSLGEFDVDFRCTENPTPKCHWAYQPASGTEEAKWVECPGDRELPPFED